MNRSFYLIIFAVLVFAATANAQPDTLWCQTYGQVSYDDAYCVRPTDDGGYILVGTAYTDTINYYDVFLIKTDAAGNEQWSQTFGGTSDDCGYGVQQTSDGGYIIGGYSYSFSGTYPDFYLIKTDPSGNEEWSQTLGTEYHDFGYCVELTTDGGYIMAGKAFSFNGSDVLLIKTDASGNELWSQTYTGSATSVDVGYNVKPTSDGGYIITGFNQPDQLADDRDVYLIKTDASGNEQWSQMYREAVHNDEGNAVQQTSDGGYIITGYTIPSGANYDAYLIKTDASGNMEWSQSYGGADEWDKGYDVLQTDDGGYIMVGYTGTYGAGSYDIWVIKTDASGNEEWNQTVGGSENDYAYSVQPTDVEDTYVIAGCTQSFGVGDYDAFLVCLGPENGVLDPGSMQHLTYALHGAYPNPFNPTTAISFDLPVAVAVEFTVLDVQGRTVGVQNFEPLKAGHHIISFDGSHLGSGIYFYQLTAGGFSGGGKMVLLK